MTDGRLRAGPRIVVRGRPRCRVRSRSARRDAMGEGVHMKLLYFDDFRLGVLAPGGDRVVDVAAEVADLPHLAPEDQMAGVIEHFDAVRPRLEAAASAGEGIPLERVRIRPPGATAHEHRVHGGELHGGRHPRRTCADQRIPEDPGQSRWARGDPAPARHPRHHLRGRGGAGPGHRQAGARRRRGRRARPRLRVHEFHRWVRPGRARVSTR